MEAAANSILKNIWGRWGTRLSFPRPLLKTEIEVEIARRKKILFMGERRFL